MPEPALSVVRFVNTGNVAIEPSDFFAPLAVVFGGPVQAMYAWRTHARPSDLAVEITEEDDRAVIAPLLINPGDMFEVQILTSRLPTDIRIEGRVSELANIRKSELPLPPAGSTRREPTRWVRVLEGLQPAAVMALVSPLAFVERLPLSTRISALTSAAIVLFLVLPLYARATRRRRSAWGL